eukprot:85166-Rhodomonas_salina.1
MSRSSRLRISPPTRTSPAPSPTMSDCASAIVVQQPYRWVDKVHGNLGGRKEHEQKSDLRARLLLLHEGEPGGNTRGVAHAVGDSNSPPQTPK